MATITRTRQVSVELSWAEIVAAVQAHLNLAQLTHEGSIITQLRPKPEDGDVVVMTFTRSDTV